MTIAPLVGMLKAKSGLEVDGDEFEMEKGKGGERERERIPQQTPLYTVCIYTCTCRHMVRQRYFARSEP